ncbi:MAG: hypothetical protein Q8P81_02995 [Nanoarchaeota archaeon]|nr:hypothetical protein [Nanoarchaeota archaeon]
MSMAESTQYLVGGTESEEETRKFIKKFTKMDSKKAVEMRKELEALDLMRLKQESIVKIIDVLPEDSESLNKIFEDSKLNEDETKSVLQTVEKFK